MPINKYSIRNCFNNDENISKIKQDISVIEINTEKLLLIFQNVNIKCKIRVTEKIKKEILNLIIK